MSSTRRTTKDLTAYSVWLTRTGLTINQTEPISHSGEDEHLLVEHNQIGWKFFILKSIVWAENEAHAVSICHSKRSQMLANDEWPLPVPGQEY